MHSKEASAVRADRGQIPDRCSLEASQGQFPRTNMRMRCNIRIAPALMGRSCCIAAKDSRKKSIGAEHPREVVARMRGHAGATMGQATVPLPGFAGRPIVGVNDAEMETACSLKRTN